MIATRAYLNWMCQLVSAGTADYRRGDNIRPALNVGTVNETSKILD
jgi:hypothetical protein